MADSSTSSLDYIYNGRTLIRRYDAADKSDTIKGLEKDLAAMGSDG